MIPPYYLEGISFDDQGDPQQDSAYSDEEFARAAWLSQEPLRNFPDERIDDENGSH